MAILLSMGTRPEIIKMMPVYFALKERGADVRLLHTGQHEQMAKDLYELYGVAPDHTCSIQRKSSGLSHLTALLLEAISDAVTSTSPSALLVHGDTTSAMAGALTAYYHQIPVGHVEAGLRTHELYDPFPEEKNREIIARLSHWHFAPTRRAETNLLSEGIQKSRVHVVGNTAVDAAIDGSLLADGLLERSRHLLPKELEPLRSLSPQDRLILITAHRRENWGAGIRQIARAARKILERDPRARIAWPVHANPQVADAVKEELAGFQNSPNDPRLLLCGPMSYPTVLWCMKRAWLIMTDSGGIQEEAAALDKPVLILRKSTERPELVEAGRGILVGTETSEILSRFEDLCSNPSRYQSMLKSPNPFGDGLAAARIAEIILRDLGRRPNPSVHAQPASPSLPDYSLLPFSMSNPAEPILPVNLR